MNIRNQLKSFLQDRNAHATLEDAVKDFPINQVNTLVPEIGYTAWQLVEHIRLAQEDILEFMVKPDYRERQWPQDYWPAASDQADQGTWSASVKGIMDDQETLIRMLDDPDCDLYRAIPYAEKYTLFREFLLIIDHNAYHIGQIIMLRKLLGIWR